MRLVLEKNVTARNVSDIIRLVVESLTDKKLDKLPSRTSVGRIIDEANSLAKDHVGQKIMEGVNVREHEGNTLHGDGTSKKCVESSNSDSSSSFDPFESTLAYTSPEKKNPKRKLNSPTPQPSESLDYSSDSQEFFCPQNQLEAIDLDALEFENES